MQPVHDLVTVLRRFGLRPRQAYRHPVDVSQLTIGNGNQMLFYSQKEFFPGHGQVVDPANGGYVLVDSQKRKTNSSTKFPKHCK